MPRHGNKTQLLCNAFQICLMQGGYLDCNPGSDGYFGRETKAALAAFQKKHDLYASGEADDMTKAILLDECVGLLMKRGFLCEIKR